MRGARYLHVLSPVPARLGERPGRHRALGPAGPAQRRCSRCSRPSTATSPAPCRSATAFRSRTISSAASVRAPVRRARHVRTSLKRSRQLADRNIDRYGYSPRSSGEEQTVRHHPGRPFQPGQSHRHLAHRTTGLRRRARPVRSRLPGRRAGPGLAATRPRTAATNRRGVGSSLTTRSPRSWDGSATTPARRRATARTLDTAVGINSIERFLGDEAIRAGLEAAARRTRHRASGCSSSVPARPDCRPPITCAGSAMPSRSVTRAARRAA